MWTQRAHFDIAMRSATNEKPPQQIYVSCNFCGKSISAFMQGLSRTRGPFGRLGSTPNKLKVIGFGLYLSRNSNHVNSICYCLDVFVSQLSKTAAEMCDLFDAHGHRKRITNDNVWC